jgi:hypothetical protein
MSCEKHRKQQMFCPVCLEEAYISFDVGVCISCPAFPSTTRLLTEYERLERLRLEDESPHMDTNRPTECVTWE